MIVKAKFIGTNNSLGYLKGVPYLLNFTQVKNNMITISRHGEPKTSCGFCLYQNLEKFLDNWSEMTSIK